MPSPRHHADSAPSSSARDAATDHHHDAPPPPPPLATVHESAHSHRQEEGGDDYHDHHRHHHHRQRRRQAAEGADQANSVPLHQRTLRSATAGAEVEPTEYYDKHDSFLDAVQCSPLTVPAIRSATEQQLRPIVKVLNDTRLLVAVRPLRSPKAHPTTHTSTSHTLLFYFTLT